MKIAITCAVCGKQVFRFACHARAPKQFCSWACSHASKRIPIEVKFAAKISPVNASGCILWTGRRNYRGYGLVQARENKIRRAVGAHCLAYEMANGPIPNGMYVCHKCDVPACVNPDHLFLGTPAENAADMARKGRACKGSACHRSKLSVGQVLEIRQLYRPHSVTSYDLAEQFGVSQASIYAIVSRRTWKHVP